MNTNTHKSKVEIRNFPFNIAVVCQLRVKIEKSNHEFAVYLHGVLFAALILLNLIFFKEIETITLIGIKDEKLINLKSMLNLRIHLVAIPYTMYYNWYGSCLVSVHSTAFPKYKYCSNAS